MNRGTRMAGMRLGLTYAAALVVLGLLIAMVAAPAPAQTRAGTTSRSGVQLQRNARPEAANALGQGPFSFTGVPDRSRPTASVAQPAPAGRIRNPR